MNVISLKDYAAQKNISYEAVRQQVVRYKDELSGHVIRDGRQQFLDEEAVAFLDAKRQKNPVALIQQNKDEQIEELENQVKQLLVKTAAQAERIAELAQWKADNAMLLAEAEQNRLALEEAKETQRALEAARDTYQAQAERTAQELSSAMEEIDRRRDAEERWAKDIEETYKKASDMVEKERKAHLEELARESQRADQAESALVAYKQKSFGSKLRKFFFGE